MAIPDNGSNYYKYEVYSQDIPTDKLYVPKPFDEKAWLEQYLKDREGTEASYWDKRRFKRHMKSPEGQAALQAARQAHFASEVKKHVGSAKVSYPTNPVYIPTIKQDDITRNDVKKKFPKKSTWKTTNANIAQGATSYKVQQGNTLSQIVSDYNKKNNTSLTWQEVAKWSGIEDPSKMSIGHTINFSDPSLQQDSSQQDQQIESNLYNQDLYKNFFKTFYKQYPVHPYSFDARQRLLFNNQYFKQGGTMNKINYFQQGGAAPKQQDMQQQLIALVQAAMQGDQKATNTINQILEAAKAGDQQAMQLAQMIQQIAKQMQGQATAAKWGAKLSYIRSLKYANGGKACPTCQAGAPVPKAQDKDYIKLNKKVEEKACGGKAKKAKKRYFGGWL